MELIIGIIVGAITVGVITGATLGLILIRLRTPNLEKRRKKLEREYEQTRETLINLRASVKLEEQIQEMQQEIMDLYDKTTEKPN